MATQYTPTSRMVAPAALAPLPIDTSSAATMHCRRRQNTQPSGVCSVLCQSPKREVQGCWPVGALRRRAALCVRGPRSPGLHLRRMLACTHLHEHGTSCQCSGTEQHFSAPDGTDVAAQVGRAVAQGHERDCNPASASGSARSCRSMHRMVRPPVLSACTAGTHTCSGRPQLPRGPPPANRGLILGTLCATSAMVGLKYSSAVSPSKQKQRGSRAATNACTQQGGRLSASLGEGWTPDHAACMQAHLCKHH
jgi:hypothetical protein